MDNIKVKRFEHYQFTDRDVNKFLEENDAEYVDMKCTNDSIFLIYRNLKSDDDNCDKTYRETIDEYLGTENINVEEE